MSVQAPVGRSLVGPDSDTQVVPTLDPPPAVAGAMGPAHGADQGDTQRFLEGPVAGALALIAVLVFPLVEAVRILSGTGALFLTRSMAMSDVGARQASHLDRLNGPLTPFGFHQPGPALYYLLAAFVRMAPATRGVFVGAVVLNGAVLGVAVAVTWRRFGGPAALWTAAAIDVWCVSVGVASLRNAGAAAMTVAPIVLFVVLWVAAVSGTRGAYLWAVVVASFEVQTHVVTAVFCAGMLLIGAVASMVAAGGDGRLKLPDRWWTSPARSIGLVVLVLAWVPPVVALTGGRPDNVRALYDFLTHAYPTPGLHHALTAAATAMTTLPLGRARPADALVARSAGALVAVGTAAVVLLALTLWLGYQRRSRAAYSFAAAAVVGGVIGALSLTRSVTAAGPPTAGWLAYVPLSLLMGFGVALLGPLGPERAGPGFVASAKAPFKWVKKRAAKHARRPRVAVPSDERRNRHQGGVQGGKKAGGKLAGKAGGVARRRPLVPTAQWVGPAVWVVPTLIVLTSVAATAVVRSDLRTAPLRLSPQSPVGVEARPPPTR